MFKSVFKGFLFILALVGFILGSTNTVTASGVAVIEQSVEGLGTAFSGGAASAMDASTLFFNPAGMSRLSGSEVKSAVHVIVPHADFENKGSTTALGTPLTGGDGGDGGTIAVIPNFYFVHSFTEDFKAGVAVNVPFGFTTEYDSDWVGRYHAIKSELANININPSISYRFCKYFSAGFGVSAQHTTLKMSQAVDYGLIGALGGLGTMPQSMDGKAKMDADDWGYGYNFGFLVEMTENTRLGFSYRSKIDMKYDGDVEYRTPAAMAGVAAAMGLVDGDISGEIAFPESASLSFYHAFNEKWAMMADVSWTGWDRFEEIRIEFDNGAADSVTTLEWEDTWRYSIGATYSPNDTWIFRAGLAFDESPIPGAEHRTPRIPGEDRLWVTFGTGYAFSENLMLDFGYAHIFVDDPKIEKTATGEDAARGALVGEFDASVDIFSLELKYMF